MRASRPADALEDRREPRLLRIIGEDLALVLHRRGQRQRLAAGAGAKSSTCMPGMAPASSAASCEPSSWTSNQPFWKAGSACTLGCRPCPGDRRNAEPCGASAVAAAPVSVELGQNAVAVGLSAC